MKRLYDSLRPCAKEEEVKAEFCKFFKTKIFALRGIDHYTEHVLFEFKYDRNFRNAENVARVLAQTMYYARLLKYGAGLTKYPLPPYICVVDKNEAFFAETKDYAKFYAAKGDRYDWDRAPSTPCPRLVEDVLEFLTQRRRGAEGWKLCNCGNVETAISQCGIEGTQAMNNSAIPQLHNSTIPQSHKPFGLSPEACAVLDAARVLYREFYANITRTPWMDWKIETWDVGYYQVRNAMKNIFSTQRHRGTERGEPSESPCLCVKNNPVLVLREAHDALRAKLLPQIYSLGFLNPDVEYFK